MHEQSQGTNPRGAEFSRRTGQIPQRWAPCRGQQPPDRRHQPVRRAAPLHRPGQPVRRVGPKDNSNNVATQAQVINILLCPSDPLPADVVDHSAAVTPAWSWGFYGMSSYGGNAGTRSLPFAGISRDGVFFIDSRVREADIRDGTSNTFLFGERKHRDPEFDLRQPIVSPGIAPLTQLGKWGFVAGPPGIMANVTLHSAEPINYRMPTGGDVVALFNRSTAFGSDHPGGANFAFADGSVKFLSESISPETLKALSTRCGG